MRLIPVLDVRGGVAVRAAGGDRSRYPPLASVLAPGCDPRDLARACRERLGTDFLYVADLDAIAGRGADVSGAAALVERLAGDGARVWIDAGAGDVAAAEALLLAGASRVVVALETLPGLEALHALPDRLGPDGLAFGLDLKGGRPLARAGELSAMQPEGIARAALSAGYGAIIALDLERVGGGSGPAVGLLAGVRREATGCTWVAGGGVRDAADLRALGEAGWQACLVGTALHAGRVGAADVRALAGCGTQPPSSDSR
ncbi:MAG TPA: HisA/HisF-related TIM barrel protein [Gemmatimonadota bacterium]